MTGKPTQRDYDGPTITTHMARITPCSSVQRIQNQINLDDDQGNELAEELLGLNTYG